MTFIPRRYTVTILRGKKPVRSEVTVEFPQSCIRCHKTWEVREGRTYNGRYDTKGRAARCEHCQAHHFEVIDEWVGSLKR